MYLFLAAVYLPFFLRRKTEHGISVGLVKTELILKWSQTKEMTFWIELLCSTFKRLMIMGDKILPIATAKAMVFVCLC